MTLLTSDRTLLSKVHASSSETSAHAKEDKIRDIFICISIKIGSKKLQRSLVMLLVKLQFSIFSCSWALLTKEHLR